MPAARPNPGEARFLQKQFLTERSYPEPSQTTTEGMNCGGARPRCQQQSAARNPKPRLVAESRAASGNENFSLEKIPIVD
jgi:hypothetical protein